ncbi:MAG: hypothetical protein L3J82_09180 [Planctomycetes bacterium]|nr:hypothetical protein [Planctomycetota bacterium]
MSKPELATDDYAQQRKAARKAHIWVNVIIFLSSAAGALFLVFVFSKIFPSDRKPADEVEVPTATLSKSIAALQGENEVGLVVDIRDVDATEGYVEAYSKQLKRDIGISNSGRLYRLVLSNVGEQELDLSKLKIELSGGYEILPLADFTAKPTAQGKLHVQQSKFRITLPAGAVYQCLVFAEANAGERPKSVLNMKSATVTDPSGKIILAKTQIKAQHP